MQGPQGIQGETGPQGKSVFDTWLTIDGNEGGTDENFLASLVGPVGPQGEVGAIGATGPQGERGPKGEDSTVPGPQGDKGETGPQGKQGDTGVQGPKGDTGSKGETGERGPVGPAGTSVTEADLIKSAICTTGQGGNQRLAMGTACNGVPSITVYVPTMTAGTFSVEQDTSTVETTE